MMLRFVKILYRSGWEFWLLLPAIAGLLWAVGNSMKTEVLTRSYSSVNPLQADTSVEANLPEVILAINAVIDRNKGMTTVSVRTNNPNSVNLIYRFQQIEMAQLEAAIAQELGIPPESVRRLASYRIQD